MELHLETNPFSYMPFCPACDTCANKCCVVKRVEFDRELHLVHIQVKCGLPDQEFFQVTRGWKMVRPAGIEEPRSNFSTWCPPGKTLGQKAKIKTPKSKLTDELMSELMQKFDNGTTFDMVGFKKALAEAKGE